MADSPQYRQRFFCSTFLLLLSCVLLTAGATTLRAQISIVPSDSAKLLQRLFMARGSTSGGEQVGRAVGPLGDINNDGLADFAWYRMIDHKWFIHLGDRDSISTTPYQVLDSLTSIPPHPVLGNFFGDGQRYVGFSAPFRVDSSFTRPRVYMRYRLLPVLGDTLCYAESLVLAPELTWRAGVELTPDEILAADLDQDGDDELIVFNGVRIDSNRSDNKPEIWIFEGGEDFSLEKPSYVLRDTTDNESFYEATIGDLDSDGYPDLIVGMNYYKPGETLFSYRLSVWWGREQLDDLPQIADRSIPLNGGDYPLLPQSATFLPLFDANNDGKPELYFNAVGGDWYMYDLGNSTKDPRSRSFRLDDAEQIWRNYHRMFPIGTLGDTTNGYGAVGWVDTDPNGGSRLVALFGGPNGPNPTYDAYYSTVADGMVYGPLFRIGGPVGDVNGDGYDDIIAADQYWFSQSAGMVVVLAGGPYLYNDDWTVGVEEASTSQQSNTTLQTYPNPFRSHLSITPNCSNCSGPLTLTIFNAVGEEIDETTLYAHQQLMINTQGWPSGPVFLALRDQHGSILATTTAVRRE